MAKVIFLHLSVIHSVHGRGGGLPQCMLGYHPHPPGQTPSPGPDTPPEQTPPPLGPDTSTTTHPPGPDTTPPGADTPLREADSSIRSTSGRYASYWNAFLLCVCYLYSLLHARERAKISSMSPALDRGKLKPLIKTFYLKLSDHKRHQQSSWYNLITSSKMISHKPSLIVFRLLRFHSE